MAHLSNLLVHERNKIQRKAPNKVVKELKCVKYDEANVMLPVLCGVDAKGMIYKAGVYDLARL